MNPAKLPNIFTFIIGIIFLVSHVCNSIEIIDTSIYKDSIYPANATDYYRYASYVPRRYRRQNTNRDCAIPINPHSSYQIKKGSEINHYAEAFSVLEITCDTGYGRPPLTEKTSTCVNGQWSPILMVCLRTCKSLMSTMSTNVTCYYISGTEGRNLLLNNCLRPVEGTTVELSCNAFYESEVIGRNPKRACRNGKWTSLPECYASCGSKTSRGTVNIVGGVNAFRGDYPWQIGIYTNEKIFQCGGSVIRENLVLSAAHCVADYKGVKFPAENYLIAAGKYYRDYDATNDSYAQYSNVSEIFIPERYTSGEGFYAFDVTVLLLENPFRITQSVQLVCIELNSYSQINNFLMNSNGGIVTGWGYTEEGQFLSDVLKEVVIPYVPFKNCYDDLPRNFRKYVTFDKICGGYVNNGTAVCGGDSGGALVYNISERYFVKGIVSTSPTSVDAAVPQCNSNQYGLYTSVWKHIEFIQGIVTNHDWVQPLECEQDDCTTLNKNSNEVTANSCVLPNFPPHGQYSFNDPNTKYTPGSSLQQSSAILLHCDSGYETNSSLIYCLGNGLWIPNGGICTPIVSTRIPSAPAVGDRSREKCQEYAKYACENEDLPHFNCPIVEVGNTVQLSLAQPKEFPQIASIGIEGDDKKIIWGCLGILISENFVLSTAKCSSYTRNLKPVQYVLLGELVTDSIEDDARTQQIPIKRVVIHPEYKPPSVYNDIGLIELEHSATLDTYVRPACINTNPNLSNEFGVEAGWGRNSNLPQVNKHMHKVTLNMFTQNECNDIYRTEPKDTLENGILEQLQLCAGSRSEYGVDICRAGGALQIVNSGNLSCTYSIIGLSAHGKDCGVPNAPGIYTKVSSYIKWIEDIVWPEN